MAITAYQKTLLFKRPRKGLWFLVLGASLLVHFLIFVMPLQLSKISRYNQENPQTILTVTFANVYKPTIPQTRSPATPRISYASRLPHPYKPRNTGIQKIDLIPKSATHALAVEALPDSRPKLDIAKIAVAVVHEVGEMEKAQGTNFIPRDHLAMQDNVERNLSSLKEDRKDEKHTQPIVMQYADGMIKYRTIFGSLCFKPIPEAINSNIGSKYTAGMGCQ